MKNSDPSSRQDSREPRSGETSSASFKVGAIALAFLIIGYQAALFVTRASRLRLEANRDHPDTVYIRTAPGPAVPFSPSQAQGRENARPAVPVPGRSQGDTVRRNAPHSDYVEAYRRATRRVESFRFNPNTISVEDLVRLGFSEKQAQSIDNYRQKGGRFRRKSDFAKSFVVADSVYRRLEPYIDIPRLDINQADSSAFEALPGIGPYFAAKMVSYRDELGGYSYPEQLMDIYHFDREKYDGLSDLIRCSPPEPYPLWSLPEAELRKHPYIRSRQAARAIVLFRDNTPPEGCTVQALAAAGILPPDQTEKLARCRIAEP